VARKAPPDDRRWAALETEISEQRARGLRRTLLGMIERGDLAHVQARRSRALW
jgi:hypothetical protein